LIASQADVFYLTTEEVFGAARGTLATHGLKSLITIRKEEYDRFARRSLPDRFVTHGLPSVCMPATENEQSGEEHRLTGTGCSSGVAQGEAIVVTDQTKTKETAGKVLVARSTDPGWVFIMLSSKGIVVEKGSILSHTAIIGRELGIPTVVGVRNATSIIPNGSRITIDGGKGEVLWD